MGKKNRRKKDNKKERKDRLQERRELLTDETVEHIELEGVEEWEEDSYAPLLQVGQRVFFPQNLDSRSDTLWRRAIVKYVHSSGETCSLLPVESEDHPDNWWEDVPTSSVLEDQGEWTLKFRVGEGVLCRASEGWIPARVSGLWPLKMRYHENQFGDMIVPQRPSYQCLTYRNDNATIAVPEGILAIREDPQSFRFSIGEEVMIATETAVGLSPRIRQTPWIPAKVTGVDITGRKDYYATYECTFFDQKKVRMCHVLKDDDEHIASPFSTPRQRLMFDAIEQDCRYSHLDALVSSSDLDVGSFRDLLVSKAIVSGSYDALLWLQKNAAQT